MPKQSRRKRNSARAVHVSMRETWYYWSDIETNKHGENLNECLRKYGTGGWESRENNMKVKLLFLDSTKSDGYSWLLCMQKLSTGEQALVRSYEEMESTYKHPGFL